MSDEIRNQIALLRFGTIAGLVSESYDPDLSLKSYFSTMAQKKHKTYDGRIVTFSASTIERWYYTYKNKGFDALIPQRRTDAGHSRKLDDDLKQRIGYYKKEFPRLPATMIYEKLLENGASRRDVSLSTVTRYVNHLKTEDKTRSGKDMRRYEMEYVNDVWYADTTHAFSLTIDGKRLKTYIIAFMDDRSRLVTGVDVFFNDNFINVMSVMKSAVAKHGKPKMFSFDNGGPYKNGQMELLTARIGSVLNWTQPYSPQSKGKIERFFKTLKQQWLSGLKPADFKTLEQLRASLKAYVHKYNTTPHQALAMATPKDVFFTDAKSIRRLKDDQIQRSFLLEYERKVSIDNVVKIDTVEYEVPCRFSKQRIKLRYSPDFQDVYVVDPITGELERIQLLKKNDNAKIKREAFKFTGDGD